MCLHPLSSPSPFPWLHQLSGASQSWKVSSHLWQMCFILINTWMLEMALLTDYLLFRWEVGLWGSFTAGNLISYLSAISQLINRLLFSIWMANAHSLGHYLVKWATIIIKFMYLGSHYSKTCSNLLHCNQEPELSMQNNYLPESAWWWWYEGLSFVLNWK
jgi:hypothetical protein